MRSNLVEENETPQHNKRFKYICY